MSLKESTQLPSGQVDALRGGEILDTSLLSLDECVSYVMDRMN